MQIYYFLMALIIFLLPGCKQYIVWGKKNFVQAPKIRLDLAQARAFIQTRRVYDQAATVGIFDVLWLNHIVRGTYAQLYAARKGLSGEDARIFLDKHHREMEDTLSFYVLMNNDAEHRLDLKVQESGWSAYLTVDGKRYYPKMIKPAPLVPEYVKIFGYRYNQFRAPYLVTFHAKDESDADIVATADRIVLSISSVSHVLSFVYTKGGAEEAVC